MREKGPLSLPRWISPSGESSPAALARMFRHNARTLAVWLKVGRLPVHGGTRIRSAFSYLDVLPDPHDPRGPGIDMT